MRTCRRSPLRPLHRSTLSDQAGVIPSGLTLARHERARQSRMQRASLRVRGGNMRRRRTFLPRSSSDLMSDQPAPPHDYDSLVKGFSEIEAQLGAPPGSLVSLVFLDDDEHDDWSFVVRAHAIIEGAVSQMLAAALDPRLTPVFEKLELGRAGTGKLEFAKALGLLNSDQARFIRTLSELRNRCVHDLKHLDFTFRKHAAALDKQQLRNFIDSLASPMPPEHRDAFRTIACEAPRAVVATNIQMLLKDAVERGSFAKISREEAEHALRQMITGDLVPREDIDRY
jgi:hypothetical protein